jgi:glycosyltransferase involved in cell wall biosynthesis
MEQKPKVAVLTSTKNRGHLLKLQVALMRAQNYPQELITWVVVDSSEKDENSWVSIEEAVGAAGPKIIYQRVGSTTPLGTSRNITLRIARELDVSYVLFWDDDDIYKSVRIAYSVKVLEEAPPTVNVAGANSCILLLRDMAIYDCEDIRHPFISQYLTHAIESYMIVRKSYIMDHSFDAEATCTVMPPFLEGFEVPIAPLEKFHVALMVGHDTNAYDKYNYFKNVCSSDTYSRHSLLDWDDMKEWWLPTSELFNLFAEAFDGNF